MHHHKIPSCGIGLNALWGLFLVVALSALPGCRATSPEEARVQGTVKRYNELLIQGYRTLNMNLMQEAATIPQAEKLYYHMSALGEGRLRMDSTLKRLTFKKISFRGADEALVETEEIWDFTQTTIDTGKTFYEEKDFRYSMGYLLKKDGSRWLVAEANTLAGKAGTTTVPWPVQEDSTKPAGHPPVQPPAQH